MKKLNLNVTKTFLPPLEDYLKYLDRVWESEIVTNRGQLVVELEEKISKFLSLENSNLLLLNNGTIPIQIALKLLSQKGEVITTPFSYVATTASAVWEDCRPVFVDINPDYLTIDETKIESAITSKTTCILATHVFGNPCNIEIIEDIAREYGLKVIYDAAHSFGVTFNGKSIFEYGDISTCSFHATKLFHTGEGGGIFVKNPELFHKCFYSHNFGHDGPSDFHGVGINGKMSELHAAMGLSVLPYMEEIKVGRKSIVEYYDRNLDWEKLSKMRIRENTVWNYSYYPILFKCEEVLLHSLKKLNDVRIFPRRYFFPSLNTIRYLDYSPMEISESISSRILCLPLANDIDEAQLEILCNVLNESVNN